MAAGDGGSSGIAGGTSRLLRSAPRSLVWHPDRPCGLMHTCFSMIRAVPQVWHLCWLPKHLLRTRYSRLQQPTLGRASAAKHKATLLVLTTRPELLPSNFALPLPPHRKRALRAVRFRHVVPRTDLWASSRCPFATSQSNPRPPATVCARRPALSPGAAGAPTVKWPLDWRRQRHRWNQGGPVGAQRPGHRREVDGCHRRTGSR